MPKLTVQNAEIKTATVEVRTLTLSGKQVTLSVFKQIEEVGIFDLDGNLLGEPWGRVNYHPDPICKNGAEHTHVVWQHGGELRRARVPMGARFLHSDPFSTEAADRYLAAALVRHLDGDATTFDAWSSPADDPRDPGSGLPRSLYRANWSSSDLVPCPTRLDGVFFEGEVTREQWSAFEVLRTRRPDEAETASLKVRLDPYGAAIDVAVAEMRQAIASEARKRSAMNSLHKQLLELPQLFIAV